MGVESLQEAQKVLARLRELVPSTDSKSILLISTLEDILRGAEDANQDLQNRLSQFEHAYEKLTSPANRIGVLLAVLPDGKGQVAVGDSEYLVEFDPSLDAESCQRGSRVILNEAFAIIGKAADSVTGATVKVEELMEDGRIKVSTGGPGSEGRLLMRSQWLEDSKMSPGDLVRADSSERFAIEHFTQNENRDYFFEEVPETQWESIGGQEEAIRLIRETIEHPLLHPEVYERFGKRPLKGILLYGPPGCGKTLIGKAAASSISKEYGKHLGREVKEYFMYISGPRILNMWLGETERMVRDIFRIARERAKEGRLVIIFLDEAESVLRTRSSGRWLNISNTVVPQFCAELDGLVALENVVLMLTSNRPDYIDPAILRPERIDRKVKISRPSKESARDILGLYLTESVPLDPAWLARHKCDPRAARIAALDFAIESLWEATSRTEFLQAMNRNGTSHTLYWRDLISGALLKSIVDRAKQSAIRRAVADPGADIGVSPDDLVAAMESEFKENEIFPKTDTLDDWLKLLDLEPESVAAIRPIAKKSSLKLLRKTIS